jgi:hypothetical protein
VSVDGDSLVDAVPEPVNRPPARVWWLAAAGLALLAADASVAAVEGLARRQYDLL